MTNVTKIHVLDKGFVELQEVMGNDMAIVNAARVSYLQDTKGPNKDKRLLFYLMRHRHTTPFEMVEFKFRVKCPLFVARQWMRHRTWSYNEVSRRYTDEKIEFHIPDVWRLQSRSNKQGSNGISDTSFTGDLNKVIDQSLNLYHTALDAGIAKEQARLFLPQALYTEFIAKVNAHNLMHFLRLRMDPHAQYEIRVYAEAIFVHFFGNALPWTAEAFREYVLDAE